MPHSVHNTASKDMSATTTALEGFRMCELVDLLFSTVTLMPSYGVLWQYCCSSMEAAAAAAVTAAVKVVGN
eukprot:17856-Heterococcus_DN1.PRE.2